MPTFHAELHLKLILIHSTSISLQYNTPTMYYTILTLLLLITLPFINAQTLTPSTPSLTSTNLIGVSCAIYGLSSYCIAGGACCLDSTCCGIGMQCVASTTTDGYNCEPSSSSSSGVCVPVFRFEVPRGLEYC